MLELVHDGIFRKSEENYKSLIEQSNSLVPFNNCASALTDTRYIYARQVSINYIINNGFSDECPDKYISNNYNMIDELYLHFKTLAVQ